MLRHRWVIKSHRKQWDRCPYLPTSWTSKSSNGHIFRVIGPFVRGIHRSPVNYPHKGQWRGALVFSFICAWISGWVNNGQAGDFRRHCAHYDITVMRFCRIGPPSLITLYRRHNIWGFSQRLVFSFDEETRLLVYFCNEPTVSIRHSLLTEFHQGMPTYHRKDFVKSQLIVSFKHLN